MKNVEIPLHENEVKEFLSLLNAIFYDPKPPLKNNNKQLLSL